MLKIKNIIGVFLICLVTQNAAAGQLTVYGAGTTSCGTLTERYPSKYWNFADAGGTWIDGYITGVQDNSGVDLRDVDADARKAFIIQYCTNNPLNSIFDAAWALVVKLEI